MFNLNMDGLAIMIGLIVLSLFAQYIYGLNVLYRYKDIQSNIKHRAIRSSKEITEKKPPIFKVRSSFFTPVANCRKGVMNFKLSWTINNSVYDQVNSIFNSYLYNLNQKKKLNIYLIERTLIIISSLLSINILWLLMFGMWIPAASLLGALILIAVLNLMLNQKNIFKAVSLTREYLKINEDNAKLKEAFAYLKYKNIEIILRYIVIFAEPFISLLKSFKNWGK